MEHQLLLENIVRVAKIAMLYELPVVLSTVNVASGVNQPTVPELLAALNGAQQIDRTSINAWEDAEFRAALEATGRKKIVMTALWTEACLAFPNARRTAIGI